MKRNRIAALLALILLLGLCACGKTPAPQPAENSGQIADASEMTAVEEVVEAGMTPVSADALQDGTYPIAVKSSSSMFKITACLLTVKDGKMEAEMTMGGKSYLYLYPGTPEQAVAASEDCYLAPHEDADGAHCFTFPVEALDTGVPCAAFSKNKEKWYPRTLAFCLNSLPLEAFADGWLKTAESLGLADGDYTAAVTLTGGSGRASVESPALLTVTNGRITARVCWNSPNYDFMTVEGEKYLPVNTEGDSVFEIPVKALDFRLPVTADTTAMSTPYEIEYTLCFDFASLQAR